MNEDVITSKDILFIGIGRSAVCWYRAALPAMYLGADWVGLTDELHYATGIVADGVPRYTNYRIVVWQQPRSPEARQVMKRMQDHGIKVLIDCDDYLHAVRKSKDHDFRDARAFSKKELEKFERTLRQADGLILSTEWLADRYRRFNENVYVCKNGLDLGRYLKAKPEHPGVNIGWAGATGHANAFSEVFNAVKRVMDEHPETHFISVGQPFADRLMEMGIHPGRIQSIPFTSIELYPNPMMLFDIALAPSRDTNWYRAKSQLRYYEAAAVGAATLGNASLYDEIEDGVTGYQIQSNSEAEWYERLNHLVENHDHRLDMQREARRRALEQFDMTVRSEQWVKVFEEVAAGL